MKCEKCRHEINKGDLFCENCGSSVESYEKNIQKSNGKKKNKIIIGAVLVVILVLGGLFYMEYRPKDIEMEASELSKIMNSEDEKKVDEYYGDNLHVHGYLIRDTREFSDNEENGYYMLVPSMENLDDLESSNLILFAYEGKLDEDIGTGSEVTIQGKLEKNKDSIVLLNAKEIEIIKKEEPVYQIDIEELDEKYVGQKVQIYGRMIDLLGEGHYIADLELNNVLKLKGLTEQEFASYFKNGSMATVIGTLNKDGELDVKNITQNEYSKEMSYDFGLSVADCYNTLFGNAEEITIHGKYLRNPSYSVPYAIGDENGSQFIELRFSNSGSDLDKYFESGEQCVITGYISEGGRGFVLEVTAVG